jgi:hypothetical protein
MSKNRKRSSAHREVVRYLIFMPYAGTDREIGAAQWRHHVQVGNLVRNSTDAELNQRLIDNQRLAVVKSGLFAYESEVTGSLEFAPLQGREPIAATPKGSHQAGWQNWLYRPPFAFGLSSDASEAHRLQYATEPRYSETSTTDPTNKVEIW